MTAPAAIQGDYTDLRFVKGRKVAQVVIEIPIEAAESFVTAFGTPNPAKSIPVALARIQPSGLKEQLRQSVDIEREKDKEPREWSTIARSQQAGIACSDPGFRLFLAAKGYVVADAETAATAVRNICGVNSRRHFADNPDAGARWDELYSQFQLERRGAIA